jgi:hypothetical protein
MPMMSNQWIDPESCQSLAVLVETVTAPLLIQHPAPICLEMEVATSLGIPADPTQLAELIRTLAAQALAEMPAGGDLTITAQETAAGVELEIADSGRDLTERPTCLPMVASKIGASMNWQNHAAGGAVVKITFRRGVSGRMAA